MKGWSWKTLADKPRRVYFLCWTELQYIETKLFRFFCCFFFSATSFPPPTPNSFFVRLNIFLARLPGLGTLYSRASWTGNNQDDQSPTPKGDSQPEWSGGRRISNNAAKSSLLFGNGQGNTGSLASPCSVINSISLPAKAGLFFQSNTMI